MLQFRMFDLEADPTCRYDYVDVYNGHSYTVQKLGRFCGTFRPGALISTSNTMMVEMASDASTGGRGFVAYFSGGKPHVDENQFCGGRLTKPQGSVKTPNWPESDYPAGISCSWHISVDTNMVIEVKFEKMDLESDIYCRYDYVALFNGGETDDSRRLGKFCGDSVPNVVLTNGNELLVHFVSDPSVTAAGFMAHYNSIPRGSRTPTSGLNTVPRPRTDSSTTKSTTPPAKTKTKSKPTVRPKPTPKAPSGPRKPISPRPRSKPKVRPTPPAKTKPTTKTATRVNQKPAVKVTTKPKPDSKHQAKATNSASATTKPKVKPVPAAKATTKPKTNPNTKPGNKTTNAVLTGKVTSLTPGPQGRAEIEVSVIKIYRPGRLNIKKRGPTTSVTLTSTCMKCPALRKGLNYVLMGQVNNEGLGTLTPSSFALEHKPVHDKALAALAKKSC
ncbi:Procollagen C-endopeptidase enhancer 2 [Triplophysa tibetana]|uniref:Procollagen C-endopeptidase enhancer 2 n=1 Tax=Triplophysa tibetana TaxID=1572043 RepID=A0A5A9PP99_9TELE|nr:Procollagen C-endopeptidase enhancer 2 [Triplophysa tibetana]